jgi:hypothetical protein
VHTEKKKAARVIFAALLTFARPHERRRSVKTAYGKVVKITTRGHDAIRIGVYDRDGKQTAWEVFTVADIEAIERELKARRDKIARKFAKKKRAQP